MKTIKYDVAVVGGGPAGMMAAGRAAELGALVVLIEKNPILGKKLLLTGGGRCNLTNAELNVRKMVAKYGPKGKALFGSFLRFGVEDALNFFKNRGLGIKIEAENRAFPVSDKSEDVKKVLENYLKKGKVEILNNTAIIGIDKKKKLINSIKTKTDSISAKSFIIATGGKAYPETGSTGEVLGFLRDIGHSVKESDPSLVPITTQEAWSKKLSGLSFRDVLVSVFVNNKKQESREGKILFTHFGLSGPLILNMSKNISELHKKTTVTLKLDLYPNLDLKALDNKVLEVLNKFLNKKIKNCLGEIIPPRMIDSVLVLAGVDLEKESNALLKEERLRIVGQLKALEFTVTGFLGQEKAIVSSGGVSIKEVDFKTMQSKLFSNLYLAGDVLDFDRPSGGFSLQVCWTTGYLAGENSAKN